MSEYSRHLRAWRLIEPVVRALVRRKFNLTCDPIPCEGPIILIANHVTTWDPLLVAAAMGRKHIYFVASEHIFRWGRLSKLITWLAGPIARSKGASGADTARSCLKHFKDGHSICIFGEGEQTWDGRSRPVVKGTGSLVRLSRATLVTYRFEGGYCSLPRWGNEIQKGALRGRLVGLYSPEDLKGKSTDEINELIDRDIYEDAFERQKSDPVVFRGKRRAECLERMLYLCPKCRAVSTLTSREAELTCTSCGFRVRYTETGFFEPAEPFETVREWEDWQKAALLEETGIKSNEADLDETILFRDGPVTLSRIAADHDQETIGEGDLVQYKDHLECAGEVFPLAEISEMAMTQYKVLLFTAGKDYCEVRVGERTNLRKYLEVWNSCKE